MIEVFTTRELKDPFGIGRTREPAFEVVLKEDHERKMAADFKGLRDVLEDIFHLMPGWREAVTELEDFCSEPVRLKNMMAAADQIDNCKERAKEVLLRTDEALGVKRGLHIGS